MWVRLKASFAGKITTTGRLWHRNYYRMQFLVEIGLTVEEYSLGAFIEGFARGIDSYLSFLIASMN